MFLKFATESVPFSVFVRSDCHIHRLNASWLSDEPKFYDLSEFQKHQNSLKGCSQRTNIKFTLKIICIVTILNVYVTNITEK